MSNKVTKMGFICIISVVLTLCCALASESSYASTYNKTHKWYYEYTTTSKKVCTIKIKLYKYRYNKKNNVTTFKTKAYWSWNAPTDNSRFTKSKFDTINIAASAGNKKCTIVRSSIKGHHNMYKYGSKKHKYLKKIKLTPEDSRNYLDSENGNHLLYCSFWSKCLSDPGYYLYCSMGGCIECKWKINNKIKKSKLHATTRYGVNHTKSFLDGITIGLNDFVSLHYKNKTVKYMSKNVQVGK